MSTRRVWSFVLVFLLTSALAVQAGAAGPCLTEAQAQARIDQAPDGTATAADLSTKLRYGAGPFVLVDFTGDCVNPGTVTLDGRRGVWLRGLSGPGLTLDVVGSDATIVTNPAIDTILIDGGSARVETARSGATLAVANAEIYAGKIYVHTASFRNVTGFFRGSDVDTLILDGPLSAFRIRGVGYRVLIDTST